MDRREAIRGIIASTATAAGMTAVPALAQQGSSRIRARQAVRSLQISVLLSLGLKNYGGARRQAMQLAEFRKTDPYWNTYTESFEIAVILFKLTPPAEEKEWLFAARMVFESMPGLTGDLVDNVRVLAMATEGLLLAANAGKLPDLADSKAELGTFLLVFAAAAPGAERVRWAKTAMAALKANHASISEIWNGKDAPDLRYSAIAVGLSGDWAGAASLHKRMLAMPESVAAWSAGTGKGKASGFMAFHTGREAFDAEVATTHAMAGRLDEAIVALEGSRRLTPSLVRRSAPPTAAEILKAEASLVASGAVLVNLAVTLVGTLVIVSTPGPKGKLIRTTHFNHEAGGILLPSRTVNTGAFHFKTDGRLADYRRARNQKGAKQQAKLTEYVNQAAKDAQEFVGAAIREALTKAKVSPAADILVVQPATIGFLPVALAAAPGGQPLGGERQLRFVDSMTTAQVSQATAITYRKVPPALGVMALPPEAGGPAFALFEKASIGAIFRKAGVAAGAGQEAALPLQWPGQGGYWHISSHAAWNYDKPELSGVVLGAKKVATVADVTALRPSQPPRLVFLSCCETALLNTREKVDRYLSLPTAFLSVGAGGVIASHWPVSDAASALLATRFYDEHMLAKKTPAIALQAAQRWLAQGSAAQFLQYVNSLAAEDLDYRNQIGGVTGYLLQLQPDERPFADSYFWGGFQLYGA